jgi:hypothetical protein
MAIRRKYDIVIIVALVLAGLAYASFSSEFRLTEDMPVEFFDGSQLPAAKRAPEEVVAKSYWNCAVKTGAVEIWLCVPSSRRSPTGIRTFVERGWAGSKERSGPSLLAATARNLACV